MHGKKREVEGGKEGEVRMQEGVGATLPAASSRCCLVNRRDMSGFSRIVSLSEFFRRMEPEDGNIGCAV